MFTPLSLWSKKMELSVFKCSGQSTFLNLFSSCADKLLFLALLTNPSLSDNTDLIGTILGMNLITVLILFVQKLVSQNFLLKGLLFRIH